MEEEEDSLLPMEEEKDSLLPMEEEEDSLLPMEEEEDSLLPMEEEEDSLLPMEEEEDSLLPLLPLSQPSSPRPMSSSDIEDALLPSTSPATDPQPRRRSALHRAHTAPPMPTMRDLLPPPSSSSSSSSSSSCSSSMPNFGSAGFILTASCVLVIYLLLGVLVYFKYPEGFSGVETHPAVDAIYFCIVTLCTVGYGDIYPATTAAKVFSCVFVLVGFVIVDGLVSGVLKYVLGVPEKMILAGGRVVPGASSCIVDAEKGRMGICAKVALAIGVLLLCIGMGTVALYLMEDLDWMDSLYLSVMSVTTVGYGDRAFNTMPGRIFASFWLLGSTQAVARALMYLTEAWIEKRHRRIAKWVLHRDLTVDDLFAADLDQSGFISKPEFVIYKLKEMGKIGERDVMQICNQFRKLDANNVGKITLFDILDASR